MGWFDWLLGKEKKPPEPLVLGAKLRCPYGSHDSYLYVDSQNIKINNLPKACVEDCKALLNIQPFGDCYAGGACETLMKLNSKWENPVPQGEKINGKEIITTKSLLACKVVGAEFKIISSGQDGIFAKQIMLMQEMDQKYPGLREILDNPYGSLYLNKGMYKKAIQFIEDQTKKNGGDIDSFTLFDEKNIEGIYLKSAFGHLMPYCDTSTMEGFVNGMQTAGVRQNMSGTAGWDELKINKKTIEFLKKDCKETANRIETKPFYRWQEENKVFSSAVAEGVTALAYGAVMYTGIKNANSNQNKYSKPAAQEFKSVGGGTKGTGAADLGEGGKKLDYLFGKATGSKHNIERSTQMKEELAHIGVHDTPSNRVVLEKHLNGVMNDSNNILGTETRSYIAKELPGTPTIEYTTSTRESFFMGPAGGVKLESVWDSNRLITVIVKTGTK